MKISFCSIAFRKSPMNITSIIPIIAYLGYDAIEIWGNHLHNSSLDNVNLALKKHRLAVAMVSPYFDFTAGKEKWKESLRAGDKFLETAAAVGSPNIRVFTGVVGSGEATDEQWSAAVKGLKHICRLASSAKINLALETHPKTLVDTVESTLRLINDVAEDNLRVNLDIYHLWEVHGDPLWVLDKLQPFVCHVHAKNADLPPSTNSHHPLLHDKQASQEIYGITYLNAGKMPYFDFIRKLHRSRFNGYFSIEWFGDHVIDAARHELAYVRESLKILPTKL